MTPDRIQYPDSTAAGHRGSRSSRQSLPTQRVPKSRPCWALTLHCLQYASDSGYADSQHARGSGLNAMMERSPKTCQMKFISPTSRMIPKLDPPGTECLQNMACAFFGWVQYEGPTLLAASPTIELMPAHK